MCGAPLVLNENDRVTVCEYCGTQQTVPKLDDERRVALYDRANHVRRANEFDKAAAIYEQILNDEPTDAEAYWSLVLCAYGIEYVEDSQTKKRVPTVNRAQYTSIFDDENYKAALKYADKAQREVFEQEAKAINALQKEILEISQKEEPFDVFLCYKETDENGRRTHDSVLANELYHQLTQEGFKVFYSRITLEDKFGTEYEPYIFAALNSAKVMVVIGSKPEFFNSPWVKNEWSRYLALIRKGEKKTLIPAYKDMDPYDLPDEFAHLQAQDMGRLGFTQDLIRGIKKIVGAVSAPQTAEPQVKVTQNADDGSKVANFLKRGNMALEDEEWKKADGFFENALNLDPECAQAYLGKFLAKNKITTISEYFQTNAYYTHFQPKEYVAQYDDTDFINSVIAEYTVPNYLNSSDIEAMFNTYKRTYISNLTPKIGALRSAENEFKNGKLLGKAVRFAKGEFAQSLTDEMDAILNPLRQKIEVQRNVDNAQIEDIKNGYPEFLENTKLKVEQLHANALQKQEEDRLKEEKDRLDKEKARKFKIKVFAITATAITVFLILYNAVIIPAIQKIRAEELRVKAEEQRVKAEELLAAGDNNAAAIAFGRAGMPDKSMEIFDGNTISAGKDDTFGVKTDGTVEHAGAYLIDQSKLKDWSDIIEVSVGDNYALGLKADGTVLAVGYNGDGQCDVDDWSDIIQISAGGDHSLGLKTDGTVVAVGDNKYGRCDVGDWSDIAQISAGDFHTVGLRTDGTVVAVGWNVDAQCDVGDWSDIVQISAGGNHTVGLKKDGSVVAVGDNYYNPCDVGDWSDIIAVSAGGYHTVGLKSDGTVVAVGHNEYGQCDVGDWSDIAQISAGGFHTVGLKTDGTVVAVGINLLYECEVGDWTDIKVPHSDV